MRNKIISTLLLIFIILGTNLDIDTKAQESTTRSDMYIFYDKQDLKAGEETTLHFYTTLKGDLNLNFNYNSQNFDIISEEPGVFSQYLDNTSYWPRKYKTSEITELDTENKNYNANLNLRVTVAKTTHLIDITIKANKDIDLSAILNQNDFNYKTLRTYDNNYSYNISIDDSKNSKIEKCVDTYMPAAENTAGMYVYSTTNELPYGNYFACYLGKTNVTPKYMKVTMTYDTNKIKFQYPYSSGWYLIKIGGQPWDHLDGNDIQAETNGNIRTDTFTGEISSNYLETISNPEYLTGLFDWYVELAQSNANEDINAEKISDSYILSCFNLELYDENWNKIEVTNTSKNTASPIKNNITYEDNGNITKINIDYSSNFTANLGYVGFKFKTSDYSILKTESELNLDEYTIAHETINNEDYTVITQKVHFTNDTKGNLLSIYLNKLTDRKTNFDKDNFNFLFAKSDLYCYGDTVFKYIDRSESKVYNIVESIKDITPVNITTVPAKDDTPAENSVFNVMGSSQIAEFFPEGQDNTTIITEKPEKTDIVKTSDNNITLYWIAILLISVSVILITYKKSKKSHN